MSKQKKSFTLHAVYEQPLTKNPRKLPFPALRPNRRQSKNRTTSRTRQPPMPPSIPNPSSLLLGLAHPVRNNKNTNQLLDSHTPALRQLLQFQEYSTIKNLHELHRLFTVTQH